MTFVDFARMHGILIDFTPPRVRRFVGEHGLEDEIGTFAFQSRRHPKTRAWVGLCDRARVQMMDSIRRHHVANAANRIEFHP